MEAVKKFFINCWLQIYSFYSETLVPLWPFQDAFSLAWVLLIALGLIVLIVIIVCVARKSKAKKVKFFVKGVLTKTVKVKYKSAIPFFNAEVSGFDFLGWAKDVDGKVPFYGEILSKNKNLSLYAILKPTSKEQVKDSENAETVVQDENVNEPNSKYFYDEIRYAMLGYERAMQFKKLGVQRKKIIAEMFEKDEVVYLYLAVDPDFMIEKGYSVEKFSDKQFEIVPCKKAIKSNDDLTEALALVKEAMVVNNLVRSDNSYLQKPSSDEQSRKSGFAFFVKNETVATSAEDYYRILRAIVLSYQKSATIPVPSDCNGKMILKIYKKDEQIFVYLALDPTKENLQDVSFDSNFKETPAMIEIKTAEDFIKANQLIDKLMFRFGMERHPEKAVISMEDSVESSCGFGYRIKN